MWFHVSIISLLLCIEWVAREGGLKKGRWVELGGGGGEGYYRKIAKHHGTHDITVGKQVQGA
jgi:hypothetical protein